MGYVDDWGADLREAQRWRGPLSVADRLDHVRLLRMPEVIDEFVRSSVDQALTRLDTGAELVYAMHDQGADFLAGLPEPVRSAYARCCAAYRPDTT